MDRILVGGYADPLSAGIQIMDVDAKGQYAPITSLSGIANPSYMARHGDMIYTVSETFAAGGLPGGVVAVSYRNGVLSAGVRRPSGGDWPCHIIVTRDGQHLVVSNYGTGNMALLRIGTNADIAGLNDLRQHVGKSANEARQSAPHAHSATITPDGRFIIAADLGTDELVFYSIQPQTNLLRRMHAVNAKPGSGPRHAVFHPSKAILYVANEISCTVAVYAYGEDTLRPLWEHSTIKTPLGDYTVADIHISPDGEFLSVTTRGENTIATYRILADGNLIRVEVVDCGGAWPRNFAFSPDGSYVLVACQNDNFIAVLPRDVATGHIGARVGTIPVAGVSFISFL